MKGIRARILIAILMPLFILALLLAVYVVTVRVDDARANLEARGLTFAQYVVTASEFNLLIGNHTELQAFADTQVKATNLLKAMALVDKQGKIVAQSGEPSELLALEHCLERPANCQDAANHRFFFDQPILSTGISIAGNPELNPSQTSNNTPDNIGRLIFFYDSQPLADLQTSLLINGLTLTTIAALFAAIIALLFSHGLIRPIERMSSVVNAIQAGDLSARTKPSSSGELLELEHGINTMAEQVQLANENLQYEVEQATKELLHTLKELQEKNTALVAAREQAEEAGRAKDLFLAKMSHELRTPLTSIIGYLSLLEKTTAPEKREVYSKIINQASSMLLRTIDDILDYIRLEKGEIRLESINFDLPSCLRNVAALQAPVAEKKQLKLQCIIENSVPNFTTGDPARLAQIVTNLLSNAIKFTSQGFVELRASALETQGITELKLTVKDSGIGVPKEQQAKLFQPFVQAEESISRRFGGSGLGLSIIRHLVDVMGGSITMNGDTGKGLEVTVILKLSHCSQLEPEHSTLPEKSIDSTKQDKKRVLLVEDDDLTRELLLTCLEVENCVVSEAADAFVALNIVRKDKDFDLVLMDVHLPKMDGIALATLLHERNPQLPIYAITANVTGTEEQELKLAGVKQVLYKPLSTVVLRKLLSSPGSVITPITLTTDISKHSINQGEAASELIIPRGFESNEIIVEFKKLLNLVKAGLEKKDSKTTQDASHKLLGAARMFSRGIFVETIEKLESSARTGNKITTKHYLHQADLALSKLIESNKEIDET